MANYKVTWEIDIEAGTAEKAARQALAIQRDPESTATVFEVRLAGNCPACKAVAVHKSNCRIAARNGFARVDHPLTVDAAKGSK